MKVCGGCEAELLRSMIRTAMEQEADESAASSEPEKEDKKTTDSKQK
jgi:hypothetical protein